MLGLGLFETISEGGVALQRLTGRHNQPVGIKMLAEWYIGPEGRFLARIRREVR